MAFTRDPAIIPELRSIPGVKVLSYRIDGVNFLHLRLGTGGHPALKSKLVRRALAYAIDRKAIARTLLGELDPSYPASDSAVLWGHASLLPAQLGQLPSSPRSCPPPPRAGGLPARS
jgi:ABC-type transport system substrate-binding protein